MTKLRYITGLILILGVLAGCSTTRRLPQGEVLYTGVKKMVFENENDSLDMPDHVVSVAKEPLSVKPNNPLYSPYVRTGIPTGLWAWNYLYTPKEKGFKYWLYKRLAKEPVLMSRVRPELRTQVSDQIWENHGYFGVKTQYELIPSKRKPEQKTKINYYARIPAPHHYDSIEYLRGEGEVGRIIDTLRHQTLIRKGAIYNLDTLVAERNRITEEFRSRGYYYFRPDYIEYEADTTQGPYKVALRMQLSENIPPAALKPYKVGKIDLSFYDPRGGTPDTVQVNGIQVDYQNPFHFKPKLLPGMIDLKPGELMTVKAQNSTQANFSRTGIFSSVSMNVPLIDSLKEDTDSLDIRLSAVFDRPFEADFEVNFVSKSNSYLGPGVTFMLRHKNLFKGGEVFTVRFNGAYEWQTGSNSQVDYSGKINSYALGVHTSLNIPGLVTPFFTKRNLKHTTKTNFNVGVDLLNRPRYFKMFTVSGSASYDFKTSAYSSHSFTPFKLAYNRLLSTSADFDQTMQDNPAIALSFQNQFIPSLSYTYTYDRTFGFKRTRRVFWQTTFTEAGNALSGAYDLFGSNQDVKTMFGSPFSQFAKATTELKLYRQVGEGGMLASRLLIGAGHAYGNSEVMPYNEQFYIGGANSIRAFTVRSLGPGSFRPSDTDNKYSYWDQTGTFKLEANVELRFKLLGDLNGAVFVDAGNIWLLKNDPNRPGGKLNGSKFFDKIALGTGVGLRYDLSFLVLRLDMGIGIHAPYDTGKKGYYNIPKFKDGMGIHLAIGYPF